MLRIMQNGASGMACQAVALEVVANNLANIGTTGFKARRAEFADLPYREVVEPGMPVYATRPETAVGSGALPQAIIPDFACGSLVATGRPLDVAVAGSGFLAVSLPQGETAYTRDGALAIAPDGRLVHAGTGYPLAEEIVIPPEATAVTICADGKVVVSLPDGSSQEQGQIMLYRFVGPEELAAIGQNLWLAGEKGGAVTAAPPGEGGTGRLVAGMLEASNVDLAAEMVALIMAQRAYQLNARGVLVGDEMWALANELRR